MAKLFYAEQAGGNCTLIEARTQASADKRGREVMGTYDFRYARPATREDLSWILGMGGGVVFFGDNVQSIDDPRIPEEKK